MYLSMTTPPEPDQGLQPVSYFHMQQDFMEEYLINQSASSIQIGFLVTHLIQEDTANPPGQRMIPKLCWMIGTVSEMMSSK